MKMNGAGNDFVVADNRDGRFRADPKLVARICDRRFGVGADGLLLVEPAQDADFFMRYYNADGSEAEMCGNGARCIARFFSEQCGSGKRELKFETRAGLIEASVRGGQVRLKLSEPQDLRLHQTIQLKSGPREYHFINTGVPHAVFFTEDADHEMIASAGAEVRYHPDFTPRGTNVDWVQLLGRNSIRVRTYERGVEAETLACGTGVVASAIIAHVVQAILLPVRVTVQSGRVLEVGFTRKGQNFQNVTLAGPAEYSFQGRFL
ncbi:MAG TPA: diaminopimelate epimerase [Verrucomicrobiae bacterium]|nr:diaminopimelate epimerase [Verrucomicrobiae bacterium]